MKFVRKDDLTFKKGYICLNNQPVQFDGIDAFNIVEEDLQQAINRRANRVKMKQPIPYVREHASDFAVPQARVETPTIDKIVAEAKAFMDENKEADINERINGTLTYFTGLVRFIMGDEILVEEATSRLRPIDTPVLGNPLELNLEQLRAAFRTIICEEIDGKQRIITDVDEPYVDQSVLNGIWAVTHLTAPECKDVDDLFPKE